jgi:hypothetical protein
MSNNNSVNRCNVYLNAIDRERLHQLSQTYGGSGSLIIRAALQIATESAQFAKAFDDVVRRVHLRPIV